MKSFLKVDFATWFLDLPSPVHRSGYLWNIHLDILWCVLDILSNFFSPCECGGVIVRRRPSLSIMSLPMMFIVFVSTSSMLQFFAVLVPEVMSTWIVPSILILLLLKHLNSPSDLLGCWIFVLFSTSSGQFVCSWSSWGFLCLLTNMFVFCWCLFLAKILLLWSY